MNPVSRRLGLILSLCFLNAAFAAEITVEPGTGTLAVAISSASDGDTLVLQDGAYAGIATVNKSLTIRAVDRRTEPVLPETMTIQGDGITVTVQGLTFTTAIVVNQAADVRILENVWTSGDVSVTSYKTSEGDGRLVVVGNRLDWGSIREVNSDNAYIAGNVLKRGWISALVSVWIVGNEVHSPSKTIQVGSTGATARVLGNRLFCGFTSDYCVLAYAGVNHIANNLIDLDAYVTTPSGVYIAIQTHGAGYARIMNNVIRGTPGDATPSTPAIDAQTAARVSGNIVLDYVTSSLQLISASEASEVTYNLCFNNNSVDCPAGDGNLNVDPQFIDLVDFRLAPGSPAIDAGPPDYELADIDRTRNDMGIHGGPWSIGQYDVQRTPFNFAPYVYPLFKGGTAFSGGVLDVQALGVARLR